MNHRPALKLLLISFVTLILNGEQKQREFSKVNISLRTRCDIAGNAYKKNVDQCLSIWSKAHNLQLISESQASLDFPSLNITYSLTDYAPIAQASYSLWSFEANLVLPTQRWGRRIHEIILVNRLKDIEDSGLAQMDFLLSALFKDSGIGEFSNLTSQPNLIPLGMYDANPVYEIGINPTKLPAPPPYPPLQKISKIEGEVQTEVWVEASGAVHSVRRLSGPIELFPTAASYIARWEFPAAPGNSANQLRRLLVPISFVILKPGLESSPRGAYPIIGGITIVCN